MVDDGSPDGTGAIADRLAGEHAEVEVLHRTAKEGLGRAYLAGFEHALARGADLVIEMDADFSHDPADLPRLIRATDNADLALGSRYVEGGGIENWGLFRRAASAAVAACTRAPSSACRSAISPAASSASPRRALGHRLSRDAR